MAKHTQLELETMSLDDLKKNAVEEAAGPPEPEKKEAVVPNPEEQEIFVASREIDLGDGAGVEVFEAEGETREAALEALADKIAEGKRNASAKIREQETRLRELEAANKKTIPPKVNELSPDDEFVIIQELQKSPSKAFRKLFKQFTGAEPEEFQTVKAAFDAFKNRQHTAEVSSAAVSAFLAAHPDYEDDGKDGEKNTRLMQMQFNEMGITWPPKSSDELTKAYLSLKESGLLILKGEGAHSDTNGNVDGKQRIVEPTPAPTPQRTKKADSIGTQHRTPATPVNTEPSEDDAYNMPLDKLRSLANKQLSAR